MKMRIVVNAMCSRTFMNIPFSPYKAEISRKVYLFKKFKLRLKSKMETLASMLPTEVPTWNNLSGHLDSKVRGHIRSVYGHLVQLLGISSLTSYYAMQNPFSWLTNPWFSLLGTLGCAGRGSF
jgi:hypothetical protein